MMNIHLIHIENVHKLGKNYRKLNKGENSKAVLKRDVFV